MSYKSTGETAAEQAARWSKLSEASVTKAKAAAEKEKSTFDKFWEGFTSITSPKTTTTTPTAVSSTPSWILPAAIGGGALVLILLLRKSR